MKSLARAGIVAIAMLLAACGGGGGGGGFVAPPPIGRSESFTVASANTSFTYPIDVYLPPQYDANASARLPVIVAVDGDAAFGYPGGMTRFGALRDVMQQRGTAAILVGVGGTARRATDFNTPGSVPYHAFLTRELAPAIDARYRTDTAKRIFSGLSSGGTIVFLAFTYEGAVAPTFKQFWSTETAAVNGSTAPLFDAEAALAAAAQGRPVPVTLFFAGANAFNGPLVHSLYTQVASRHYAGLDLQEVMYATEHVATDLPAFTEALARFLN